MKSNQSALAAARSKISALTRDNAKLRYDVTVLSACLESAQTSAAYYKHKSNVRGILLSVVYVCLFVILLGVSLCRW